MKKILMVSAMLLATLTGYAESPHKTSVLRARTPALPVASESHYVLDTLHYAGPSEIFTDIVFLGDGFLDNEMSVFETFVENQSASFFGKTPWNRYEDMFNVFYVKTPSNESGAGTTPSSPIDNFYGVCFGTSGVDRMPWPTKWDKVYEVLLSTKPDFDMVCIVVNSYKYGGGGGGKFICYSMNENSIETLRHEAGHAFGDLADEYWYRGKEAANMTQDIDNLRWQRWMGYNGVGTYRYEEDPATEAYNWYRPHQNCLMRYLNREYCPVCCEALIERIHETSKNIMSYQPTEQNIVFSADILFALNLLKPNPNTLRVDWMLDGKIVAHNEDQWRLKTGMFKDTGVHQLTVMVEDTTLLVRTPDHTSLHAATLTWKIESYPTDIRLASITENSFTVGPLPFSTHLSFTSKQPYPQPIRMELLDMDGRIVAKQTFKGETTCTLNTPKTRDGIYVLRVYQGKQLIYTRKVMRKIDNR